MAKARFLFLILASSCLGQTAFALDVIKLNSGQIVVGEVLNDSSEFVDITLESGISKRIPKTAIASLEKDVPLPKAPDTGPHDPLGFVAVEAGGALVTSNHDSNRILFNDGVQVGFLVGHVSNFRLALAGSYNRLSITKTLDQDVFLENGYNDFNVQALFLSEDQKGLYFGPNLGVMFRSETVDDVDDGNSGNSFELGVEAGYTFFIPNSPLSLGPEVRYDHVMGPNVLNLLKVNAVLALHF